MRTIMLNVTMDGLCKSLETKYFNRGNSHYLPCSTYKNTSVMTVYETK